MKKLILLFVLSAIVSGCGTVLVKPPCKPDHIEIDGTLVQRCQKAE